MADWRGAGREGEEGRRGEGMRCREGRREDATRDEGRGVEQRTVRGDSWLANMVRVMVQVQCSEQSYVQFLSTICLVLVTILHFFASSSSKY